jgi:hypothetical protein
MRGEASVRGMRFPDLRLSPEGFGDARAHDICIVRLTMPGKPCRHLIRQVLWLPGICGTTCAKGICSPQVCRCWFIRACEMLDGME